MISFNTCAAAGLGMQPAELAGRRRGSQWIWNPPRRSKLLLVPQNPRDLRVRPLLRRVHERLGTHPFNVASNIPFQTDGTLRGTTWDLVGGLPQSLQFYTYLLNFMN